MVEICGCVSVGSVICPSVRQWCWCLSLQRDWQTPTEIQTDTNTINCLSVSRLVSVIVCQIVNCVCQAVWLVSVNLFARVCQSLNCVCQTVLFVSVNSSPQFQFCVWGTPTLQSQRTVLLEMKINQLSFALLLWPPYLCSNQSTVFVHIFEEEKSSEKNNVNITTLSKLHLALILHLCVMGIIFW